MTVYTRFEKTSNIVGNVIPSPCTLLPGSIFMGICVELLMARNNGYDNIKWGKKDKK